MTELHEAVSVGDLERVEEALKRGLDPNEPDPEWDNRTPLHIAASKGYMFMQSVFNVLLWALWSCRFKKCVYVLLQAGASPNVSTKAGWTPAHFACETGQVSLYTFHPLPKPST